jgi:hypothetical protein
MGQNQSRPRGIIALAVAEFLLGIFALTGGIVHLTLGIGGLADFGGKDLTLTSSTASALQDTFTVEGFSSWSPAMEYGQCVTGDSG